MNTLEGIPLDMLADYGDGRERMEDLTHRMSAGAVVSYADSAGPKLEVLIDTEGRDFYKGLRDALQEATDSALIRVPNLVSTWRRKAS